MRIERLTRMAGPAEPCNSISANNQSVPQLSPWKSLCTGFLVCVALAIASPAQTVTLNTLASFDLTNGANPDLMTLIQGRNGNLYGTTFAGGAIYDGSSANAGTIFKISPGGTLTSLFSFCEQDCTEGFAPFSGLVQGNDGNFYGTTSTFGGGANCATNQDGCGAVFKMTPAGVVTKLYSFCSLPGCADGGGPVGQLILGSDGNFYGTTAGGGAASPFPAGTAFKITPAGVLTTLHSFGECAQTSCPDGYSPEAGLVQASDGNFYGTTCCGGSQDDGTVFKVNAKGGFKTLYSFCSQPLCADGFAPYAALVEANNGMLYGSTIEGGADSFGTVFQINLKTDALTTVHTFNDNGDGGSPFAAMILGSDGNLYGTTSLNNVNGEGTIFRLTPSTGTLTTLYNFCIQANCMDGEEPFGGLLQDTNGKFYGTTYQGGAATGVGYGTVYSLSAGLRPFVKTQPTAGSVGAPVIILGSNLTGTTSVTFNGTAATFTVVSKSEIKTTVPTGATTGKIKVTTPTSVLTSNVSFEVN